MLHKAWNSKGEVPYCFSRSSIKFQGHTGQNITDFDPNWEFPDCRPVAAFKSLRFALFSQPQCVKCTFDLFHNSVPPHARLLCCHMIVLITRVLEKLHQCCTNAPTSIEISKSLDKIFNKVRYGWTIHERRPPPLNIEHRTCMYPHWYFWYFCGLSCCVPEILQAL